MLKKTGLTLLLLLALFSAAQAQDDGFRYTEASELTLVGKLFPDTPNPYHRVDTAKYKGFTKGENRQVRESSGIAVAFQIGTSFHPVLGYDYAGKSSFTTNVLYFKQQFGKDKTPDEIAKEKGYVRSGSVDAEEEAEEAPKAKKKAKKKKKIVEEEPEEEDSSDSASAESDESEFDDF